MTAPYPDPAIRRMELDTIRARAGSFELRHRSGMQPVDYLKQFLAVLRPLAYATQDDSWGELEKELGIVICSLIDTKRKLGEWP